MDITEMKWGKGNSLHIRDRCQKSVYSVELVDRQPKFTALVYEGEEAQDVWEEDFRQCSRNRYSAHNIGNRVTEHLVGI